MPTKMPTRASPSRSGGRAACSSASQATSSSSRCCGSIAAASRGEMPKNAASKSRTSRGGRPGAAGSPTPRRRAPCDPPARTVTRSRPDSSAVQYESRSWIPPGNRRPTPTTASGRAPPASSSRARSVLMVSRARVSGVAALLGVMGHAVLVVGVEPGGRQVAAAAGSSSRSHSTPGQGAGASVGPQQRRRQLQAEDGLQPVAQFEAHQRVEAERLERRLAGRSRPGSSRITRPASLPYLALDQVPAGRLVGGGEQRAELAAVRHRGAALLECAVQQLPGALARGVGVGVEPLPQVERHVADDLLVAAEEADQRRPGVAGREAAHPAVGRAAPRATSSAAASPTSANGPHCTLSAGRPRRLRASASASR